MIKVGLTGGMGSGKSTAARFFRLLGIPVYDSDAEARRLMNEDPGIRRSLLALFGPETYTGTGLNRTYLGGRVFTDPVLLRKLNGIVHPAVQRDFSAWAIRQHATYVMEEAAVLFESGAYRHMDRTIAVTAPERLRIERVRRRDGLEEAAIRSRMANQMNERDRIDRADFVIRADDRQLLIPQMLEIHRQLLAL